MAVTLSTFSGASAKNDVGRAYGEKAKWVCVFGQNNQVETYARSILETSFGQGDCQTAVGNIACSSDQPIVSQLDKALLHIRFM